MTGATASLVIGLDVGGTFTDAVLVDTTTGRVEIAKALSTPEDLTNGIVGAISALPKAGEARLLVHGTTTATNALLEHKTSKAGLITTKGFRDVIEIRRRDRPHTYSLRGGFEPIVPRFLRYEVDELVASDGTVERPVDREQLAEAAHALLEAGVDSVAVAFLNSYVNPANEHAAREVLEEIWPNEFISLSTEVFPAFREFERWVTTAANASVQPLIGTYLARLETSMGGLDYGGELLIMQSNGGAMSIDRTKSLGIHTVLSGPAGGVSAALRIGQAAGFESVISCDMGGTSFDVCLIADGRLPYGDGLELEYGLPLQIPALDIHTVGAGGGSIAWIDRAGILRVGPQSAGARPGPAAYGHGGTEPTVTDAHVVLGRIGTDGQFAGDEAAFQIDVDAATRSIHDQIATRLGLSVEDAAEAVLRVANTHLAGAVRRVSIQRGHDPREFALVMFGGAGPLHLTPLMRELGMRDGIVPLFPGLTSALGCALADLRYDFVKSVNQPLDRLSSDELVSILHEQAKEGERLLGTQKTLIRSISAIHEADMNYRGQTHTLRVALPIDGLTPATVLERFEQTYAGRFGRSIPDVPAHVANLRSTIVGHRPEISVVTPAPGDTGSESRVRKVRFDGNWTDAPIIDRRTLAAGSEIVGPAIVEQAGSTTVLEPGATVRVDDFLNLIVNLRA